MQLAKAHRSRLTDLNSLKTTFLNKTDFLLQFKDSNYISRSQKRYILCNLSKMEADRISVPYPTQACREVERNIQCRM